MKQSRFHDRHAQLGATFREVAGWEMPAHYGDPAAEHSAVRSGVGIADLSHRGKLRVTGEDRVKWLQSVISNDILPLKPGQGIHSAFLTHKGKMLSYFRCYMLPEAVLLEDVGEIGEATFQALRKFLLYGTKAKMESLTDRYSHLLISGPKAVELAKVAFGLDPGGLKPLEFLSQGEPGREAVMIRTEETGETDIGIIMPSEPADCLNETWKRIWEAGKAVGAVPFGTEARESLRIEAGLPKAGVELTEEIVPPEANLEGKAFSLSKGCYPGQEVVARMDTYGMVRRRLVGLKLKDSIVPPRGAKLFSGDREVGWISSAAHSPSLGQVIALGFPLRDFAQPETALTVEIEQRKHDATVQALPFYSKG
jgi:folate-binding protein YgfZ